MKCIMLALLAFCLGSTTGRGWGDRNYEDCNNERIIHLVNRACALVSRSPDGLGKSLDRGAHDDDDEGAMSMDFMTEIQEAAGATGERRQELWLGAYRRLLRHDQFYAVVRKCCSEAGCNFHNTQGLLDLCPL